jgi:hypothetical protein
MMYWGCVIVLSRRKALSPYGLTPPNCKTADNHYLPVQILSISYKGEKLPFRELVRLGTKLTVRSSHIFSDATATTADIKRDINRTLIVAETVHDVSTKAVAYPEEILHQLEKIALGIQQLQVHSATVQICLEASIKRTTDTGHVAT